MKSITFIKALFFDLIHKVLNEQHKQPSLSSLTNSPGKKSWSLRMVCGMTLVLGMKSDLVLSCHSTTTWVRGIDISMVTLKKTKLKHPYYCNKVLYFLQTRTNFCPFWNGCFVAWAKISSFFNSAFSNPLP